jgi:hypothetical protein
MFRAGVRLVVGGGCHAGPMSSYYWQCDTCHVQGPGMWSMEDAKSDFAHHHAAHHHGHLIAYVNDSRSGEHGTSYYWQCDDCHVHSSYRFDSMDEARADRSYQPAHSHHHIALVVDAS